MTTIMTETIITILQWLIPSGSLATVIIWLTNKTLRNARTNKEVHDTYKLMYEDVKRTLIELKNENKNLYRAFARLERAVSKASTCNHYDVCPIRDELQQQQKSEPKHTAKSKGRGRQRSTEDTQEDHAGGGAGVEGESEDSSGEPDEPTPGSGLY